MSTKSVLQRSTNWANKPTGSWSMDWVQINIQVNEDFRYIFIHLDIYLYPIHCPAPSWLVSSIGRALHRYRRGHGFKSRTGLNFFQVLFTTTRFSSVLSCEDLLISSLHRSANMWNFHISKICNVVCLHMRRSRIVF